jgi:hypothetical protein
MRRRAGFFLRVAIASLGAGLAFTLIFVYWETDERWPIFLLGVPGIMLLAASFLALVASWCCMVSSIPHPRNRETPRLDRLLYISSVLALLALGGFGLYCAIHGYLSGQVRIRRGFIRLSDSPLGFWLFVSLWGGIGLFFVRGAWQQFMRMIMHSRHRANPGSSGRA